MTTAPTAAPAEAVRTPGIILGIGLGGFVDGILLHQILHWHNMGSARVRPATLQALRLNMIWDGWFHAAVWLITLTGVFLLLDAARKGRRLPTPGGLAAQLILGWGIFNLVEGVIDHHLLGLHHVRDVPAYVPAYDWLFLLVGGVLLIVVGLVGSGRRAPG